LNGKTIILTTRAYEINILIINPPYISSDKDGLLHVEPLGIAYIAAAILQSGRHGVEVLDCVGLHQGRPMLVEDNKYLVGLSCDEIYEKIKNYKFNVIGISATQEFTKGEDSIGSLTSYLAENYPSVPVILGGPTATLEYKNYLSNSDVDIVVLHEGEGTIVELLDTIESGNDLSIVHGIAYTGHEGEIKKTSNRAPMDIDSLPIPARHLLPIDNYKHRRAELSRSGTPALTIYTSRACPFKCTFCNLDLVWGRMWRGRSAKLVVDEMEHIINTYNVTRILVEDSNFAVKKTRVLQICDEIIDRGINVDWYVEPGIMISLLSKEMLTKLYLSGMFQITAQLESGNPKTLEYMNKKLELEHARNIFFIANKLGMITSSNIIIGFWNETLSDIKESIDNAESFHIDQIGYLTPIPLPDTPLYSDYLREGLIEPNTCPQIPVDSLTLSGEEINNIKNTANKRHRYIRLKQLLTFSGIINEFIPKLYSLVKRTFITNRRAQTLVK